ncbi:hypothetical protein Emed_000403 [Eimeria media]
MTPKVKAVIKGQAKRPRSRLCVESFSGCCWEPQRRWLSLVFRVLCFCWIFLAKPSCAVVIKTRQQLQVNPSATTWPLSQCLHTLRQCPHPLSASSFQPEPLAAITLPLTTHSRRCITTTPECSSPHQPAAATAAGASAAARMVSSDSCCLTPSSSNSSSRALAFCKPSGKVPSRYNRRSFNPSSSPQQVGVRPHDGRECGGVVRRRWRGGVFSLLRCLDSSEGSDLSSFFPSYLNVSAEEVRGVAASLAFWLRPRAAVKSDQGAPDDVHEQHLISSVGEDLAFAWAALNEVDEMHAATPQKQRQRPPSPLPFAALREDVPRLFWHPSKSLNDGVHLPPWNADACECQQGVATAEGGAPPLPAGGGPPPSSQGPPSFFGRYLAISGFSPSSKPQAPDN